ncbi:probable LRR receptor-like serine/threonine-protein kinase At3g47570 [Miscanthus floridulus]|uniref:probable LRR receptor-like serine/threonine-protein kinase At3g47570 n=1 Tax=Miscanthus floridulus TaxID=154761 RepID=UPI00345A499A
MLTGSIPVFGSLPNLEILDVGANMLEQGDWGFLSSLSNCTKLTKLGLDSSNLQGQIPEEVGNLISLNTLSMSNNQLSHNIPSTLGQCVLLESLQLQGNLLDGSIPQSFMNLVGINEMDLSQNNLSGTIPGFLSSLSNLHILNLSFNNFEGVVPLGGIFSNGVVSIQGNDGLCTSTIPAFGLPLCTQWVHRGRTNFLIAKILLPTSFFVVVASSCLVIILKRKNKKSVPRSKQHDKDMMRLTFQDITIATDQFSSVNLICSGSFGAVYKGCLELEVNIVAIKIFNLDIFGANESFTAECETLKRIKHRNLVKVITLCSSLDLTGKEFKALVFKYMPNGNLDMWLHPEVHEPGQRKNMSLRQRISIATDVALAMDYLHNQLADPLIHCDLKPRSLACLKGSFGYIAPEYGTNVEISTRGDVYSFGVLLLEMITGTRPTDEKLNNGTNLHEYINSAFPNNIHTILDPMLRTKMKQKKQISSRIA